MQNDKILTISIAAYNVAGYIRQTLDSLLTDERTLDRTEVLIVNDGSSDDTSVIAHEYEQAHPGTFRIIDKENGGYGSTVNAGISEASGKYFKLLDGDDWFETKNISGFIAFLEGCDSDIVLTPYTKVYPKEGRTVLCDENNKVPMAVIDIEGAGVSNNIAMHEMAVRTEVLRSARVRLLEHCFYTDWDFIVKSLIGSHTISRYAEPVYCYRMGDEGQSVSISGLKKHYDDTRRVSLEIAGRIGAFVEKADDGDSKKREMLLTRLDRSLSLAYTTMLMQDGKGRVKKELKGFEVSLRKYPVAYEHSMQIKRVRLMRRTGFAFIGLYRTLFVNGKTFF